MLAIFADSAFDFALINPRDFPHESAIQSGKTLCSARPDANLFQRPNSATKRFTRLRFVLVSAADASLKYKHEAQASESRKCVNNGRAEYNAARYNHLLGRSETTRESRADDMISVRELFFNALTSFQRSV